MTPETDLDGADVVQAMKGHSGCEVYLCRAQDRYFVRKISASQLYNNRFRKQIEKQQRLASMLRVPKIIRVGEIDGRLAYDMEHIIGQDFRAHSTSEPIRWTHTFVDKIFETIDGFAAMSFGARLASSYRRKVGDLKRATTVGGQCLGLIEQLRRAFELLDDWHFEEVPATESHGDLTIENMLFRERGEIVFIDLLDSDISSFWLDIGKLLFDLDVGWSLRHVAWAGGGSAEARLLLTLCRYIAEEIVERLRQAYPDLARRLTEVKTLQALRVLPYAIDGHVFERIVAYLHRMTTN